MRTVEAQKGFGSWCIEAADQIGGLDLGFHDASSSDMVTLAGDAGNAAQCWPRGAHGLGECLCGQEGDGALIDTAMSSIGWSTPWLRGKKRGL